MNTSIVAHGRMIIDDFQERYFLFVSAATVIRLDRKLISAGTFPGTDPQFAARLFEGLGFAFREPPAGFPSDPAALHQFRILRLIEPSGRSAVSQDLRMSLDQQGDSSRVVTIAGRIATDQEKGSHDQLTEPTITLERLATFEAIQQRAFDIFQSGSHGSADDNWFRAERELLGAQDVKR